MNQIQTLEETQMVISALIDFFDSSNIHEIASELNIEPFVNGRIQHRNVVMFMAYMTKKTKYDAFAQIGFIKNLILSLVNKGVLNLVGESRSVFSNNCYETEFQMVKKTHVNDPFWVASLLGFRHIWNLYSKYVVRIEGYMEREGKIKSVTGSGILISDRVILTCKHNIYGIKDHKIYILEEEYEITDEMKTHQNEDIGLMYLNKPKKMDYYPFFETPSMLEQTITLGYPPIRGCREACLIAQTGEINSIASNWKGYECITISSITRPGNSGGPVVSANGSILGIVTQVGYECSIASVDSKDNNENIHAPFYIAITSSALEQIVQEIDNSASITFKIQ
jgi:hypothetical protein